MHEFSIAADVMAAVSEFAEAHPERKVLTVRLQVGELTCVDPEQLDFCYQSIVQGSLLAESKLEIDRTPAAIRCSRCDYEGPPRYWRDALTGSVPTLQCPRCGQAAEPTAGHECAIKSIQCLQCEMESATP